MDREEKLEQKRITDKIYRKVWREYWAENKEKLEYLSNNEYLICSICFKKKLKKDFPFAKDRKLGFYTYCKKCGLIKKNKYIIKKYGSHYNYFKNHKYNSSEKYKELTRKRDFKHNKKSVEELSDYYIKRLIKKDTDLKSNDIPDELVEAHRENLLLKRKLKEI